MNRRFLSLATATLLAAGTGSFAAEADTPPPAATVVVNRIASPPTIDGDLSEPVWADIARSHTGVFSGWTFWRGKVSKLADQQRIVYAGYDVENLYLALQSYAVDIYTLRGGRGGWPFVGECLEVFIKPKEGELFHVGIDVEGNIAIGQWGREVELGRIKKEINFGENYWAMEVAIPWELVGVKPVKGLELGFNLGANLSRQYGTSGTISWGRNYGEKKPMPTIRLEEP